MKSKDENTKTPIAFCSLATNLDQASFEETTTPSCHGVRLSFTGETFSGSKAFRYQFNYADLCQIGFLKKSDCSAREYLVVPSISRKVVKMVAADSFELVITEPRLYEKKLWQVEVNAPPAIATPPDGNHATVRTSLII